VCHDVAMALQSHRIVGPIETLGGISLRGMSRRI
jgi:hypothetical protein